MVLDGVLSAAWNALGNVCPAIPQLLVNLYQQLLFVLSPSVPLDVRPQLVVPSLSALLANPPRKVSGNSTPVTFATLFHQPAGGPNLHQQHLFAAKSCLTLLL